MHSSFFMGLHRYWLVSSYKSVDIFSGLTYSFPIISSRRDFQHFNSKSGKHNLKSFCSLQSTNYLNSDLSSLKYKKGWIANCSKFATDVGRKGDHGNLTIDSFGAWDSNFELPLLMEASIQHGKPIPHIVAEDVGYSSIVGKRTYQEDRFIVKDFEKNILCCAVFDGHGGAECSSFCADNIEGILDLKLAEQPKDLDLVLHDAILELHSSYTRWVNENDKGQRSGTTCTICLLKGGLDLAVGHVGDSRALLCRNGAARRLTVDHCPSSISERKRIEQSGGNVATDNIGRHMVNEKLNMSRSIGDLHLKKFGVTAVPDIRKLEIRHGRDAFLLLATDGIYFVLNDEEVCKVINHAQDPDSAAKSLTEQALSLSSEDNCTALVVPLGSWGNFAKSSASMFYSFGIGRDMSKSSRFG